MRVVVALGGNALLRRGEPMDAETQRGHVRQAAAVLAELSREHALVVTHGNGPQVGLLALQAEAYRGTAPYPLDVLGAESEGMIGYLIEQELSNALPGRQVATLLTQVEVAATDPAFGRPTKPIGPVYEREEGERIGRERGWVMKADGGSDAGRVRRVVPSPLPMRILELPTIRLLLDAGVIVVCAGGGGIPVIADAHDAVRGVEAVIDKDRAAALLAEGVDADALLLLTDVSGVYDGWKGERRLIPRATPAALRGMHFDEGSMGPKVDACCRFVERTGRIAAIGALSDAPAILRGEAGTHVAPDRTGATWAVRAAAAGVERQGPA